MLFRAAFVLTAALALAACSDYTGPYSASDLIKPAPPDDPRGYGHSVWCGTNPPSGYCIVPEAR
ncbi:MAG: hypothetical protein KIT16_05580 [Rhodospirillaceae bacterium]|nr:hypothetical protein [Rhodospirillaceae bacterium]